MKTLMIRAAVAGLFAISLFGCGDSSKTDNTPAPSGSQAQETVAIAKELGTEHEHGEFKFNLTAEPAELKVGKAKFIATVTHEGAPSDHATVTLKLSMPSMNMDGPSVTLQHKEGGRYEGEAELSMGSEYEAMLTADDHGSSDSAKYKFSVSQ